MRTDKYELWFDIRFHDTSSYISFYTIVLRQILTCFSQALSHKQKGLLLSLDLLECHTLFLLVFEVLCI